MSASILSICAQAPSVKAHASVSPITASEPAKCDAHPSTCARSRGRHERVRVEMLPSPADRSRRLPNGPRGRPWDRKPWVTGVTGKPQPAPTKLSVSRRTLFFVAIGPFDLRSYRVSRGLWPHNNIRVGKITYASRRSGRRRDRAPVRCEGIASKRLARLIVRAG